MPTISKRTKQARNLIIKPSYSLEEGVKILKQTATTKFVESAEAHFNLNLDTIEEERKNAPMNEEKKNVPMKSPIKSPIKTFSPIK